MIHEAASRKQVGTMKVLKFDLFQFSVYCIVIGVTFGSAINFGFVFGSWFYPVLGEGTLADAFVSWATGILLGLGAFGLFLKSEKALKTILRIKSVAERRTRAIGLGLLNLLFVGVGIAGLLFRSSFLSSRGVGYLVFIGIAVEFMPFLIGLVLYPIQNPDVRQLEEDLGEQFDREVVSEVYSHMKNLPLKSRYAAYTGDFGAALDGAVQQLDDAPKQIERRGIPRGGVQISEETPQQIGPTTQPLNPTAEVDEVALMKILMQKYGSADFLQSLQNKNRA